MTTHLLPAIESELVRVILSVRDTELTEESARRVIRILEPYLENVSQHSLSSMMVEALFKLRAAVRHYGKNSIHLRDQMNCGSPFDLSFDQVTNFSKLRAFGLAHHADKNNPRSGNWCLTFRGSAFLLGEITIPRKVFTFRGHPVDSPEPVKPVQILEYRKELPSFETYYDFAPRTSSTDQQLTLA